MEQMPASAAEEICPSETLDQPNKDRHCARLSLEDFSNAGNTFFFVVVFIYCFSLLLHSLVCVHHIIGKETAASVCHLATFLNQCTICSEPKRRISLHLHEAELFLVAAWSVGDSAEDCRIQTTVWTKHCRCSGRRGRFREHVKRPKCSLMSTYELETHPKGAPCQ